MKVKKFDSVAIWSSDWRALVDWYKDVFNLEENMTLNLPDDTGTNLVIGDGSVLFWIGSHDKVEGKSKDPHRIMPAFVIDNVDEVFEQLKKKNVKIVAGPNLSPTKDFHYITIQDPEDNMINLYCFDVEGHEQ